MLITNSNLQNNLNSRFFPESVRDCDDQTGISIHTKLHRNFTDVEQFFALR